jgi:hypothetical protein
MSAVDTKVCPGKCKPNGSHHCILYSQSCKVLILFIRRMSSGNPTNAKHTLLTTIFHPELHLMIVSGHMSPLQATIPVFVGSRSRSISSVGSDLTVSVSVSFQLPVISTVPIVNDTKRFSHDERFD